MSRADGYHFLVKVNVLMSYELVAAFRVMVDTDQLNIQYHNYSKSWCNVSHMDSSINLRPPPGTESLQYGHTPQYIEQDVNHSVFHIP